MDISSIEQLIGRQPSDIKPQTAGQSSRISPERATPRSDSRKEAPAELQPETHPSFLTEWDPADPSVQKSTLEIVDSLLKYHNIGLQASLHHRGQEAYIALHDTESGLEIKRMKIEEVLRVLARTNHHIVDDSV
ncbi:hypothetical protein VA7868_04254 [Vibrio aerogenes CECT 7868]|uniref:Uncharacterized protein n=1 Tax=Vibrio aerogenes CECT 7868 TaxID=1216006 RepID=A0A1M6DJS5_9VIBR|nr:hypothetical protein [Vibrio aerogenes]SHI73597.1 hypothetical protein VA7868_04254 [Vibrio aerogenes CECT 7868]